jgi:hypothetical protein
MQAAREVRGWSPSRISAGSRWPPRARYRRKPITEWLYRADLSSISRSSHRSASYSICLKNFIGCTHLRQRPYLIDRDHWEELVAEFNLACRPDLNIVDGTVSMIEGGPWEGTPAPTGIIIASGDRVAADIAGLGVIRSSAGEAGHGAGLGTAANPDALALGLGKERDIFLRTGKGTISSPADARDTAETGPEPFSRWNAPAQIGDIRSW